MKRGQVTMFVIVGLVILLIIGLVFLLPNREPKTAAARQNAEQVTNIVQQCLAISSRQALEQISFQGGYATLRSLRTQGRDVQVVNFPPQQIPLWHEAHSCNQNPLGCVSNNRPRLCAKGSSCPLMNDSGVEPSIEENIEVVATPLLVDCLRNFSMIRGFSATAMDDPEIDIVIRKDDIAVSLEYPIDLATEDQQQVRVDTFSTTLPVNIVQTYELSKKLHELEWDPLESTCRHASLSIL